MHEDTRHLGRTVGSDDSVDSFEKVEDSPPDGESPSEVSETCGGFTWEISSDETAGGMGVESEHEEKGEVMGIPERLETLFSNFGMGRLQV